MQDLYHQQYDGPLLAIGICSDSDLLANASQTLTILKSAEVMEAYTLSMPL